ncbi:MAG: acyl-CoA thioesterase [Thermoanaerobaculia bacterium]
MSGRDKQIPRHATSGWRDGWYVAPMHVILRDLDAFGHVNHAVYLTYFEWARTEMWLELTGRDDVRGITFILARAECDYRLQLALEPIEVAVRIQDMRSTSLDFVSEIRKADGRVAATGKVVVVLFDYETQSKVPVSDELRKAVALFQKEED